MTTSPNGIIILDQELNVLNYNPAFSKLFHNNTSCIGKTVSQFMDPDPFTKVASGQSEMFDQIITLATMNLSFRLLVYALKEEKQYVGIFIVIPSGRINAERLEKIKEETIEQAKELYKHQIAMAKEFAIFLGEYTSKGEELVQKIVDAVKEDP
ncbi:MAG: PAS domain-containing protein [Candidatus Omnitrophica bacterium]|nr:PAS domain-containing protein [Candidatus Omnitrophota bacterium]